MNCTMSFTFSKCPEVHINVGGPSNKAVTGIPSISFFLENCLLGDVRDNSVTTMWDPS